jgi:hypothetical protein
MEDWNIFGENEFGKPADPHQLFEYIDHMVKEHDMPVKQALDILIDMVRPGTSENSHDVRQLWVGAMHAYGFAEVCDSIPSMWLNVMPWGVGFAIHVDHEFNFKALSKPAQRSVIEAMAIVLRAGGMGATVNDDNEITITNDEGETSTMTVDSIVKQFRNELEEELGPDAEEPKNPNDPFGRWMP